MRILWNLWKWAVMLSVLLGIFAAVVLIIGCCMGSPECGEYLVFAGVVAAYVFTGFASLGFILFLLQIIGFIDRKTK
jgi:hypothetical protein